MLVVERSVESVYVFIADRGGDFLNRESSRTDEFFRAFEPLCDEKLLEIFAEDFFCQPRKILYVHAEFPSTRRKASADEPYFLIAISYFASRTSGNASEKSVVFF